MRKSWLVVALAIVCCAQSASANDLAQFRTESRAVVKEVMTKLGSALKKEMTTKGPAAAITVCKDLAPAVLADISRKTGMRVTRVSLKTRDPLLGTPDAWEQQVLLDFDARLRKKEDPATLEHAEIVAEPQGIFLRYMKAIPVQPICLKCHGPVDKIAPQVRKALAAAYPHDKAVGYSVGQLRGAFSIEKALSGK